MKKVAGLPLKLIDREIRPQHVGRPMKIFICLYLREDESRIFRRKQQTSPFISS